MKYNLIPAWRILLLGRVSRLQAGVRPFLVEPLEERVLLSHGLDAGGTETHGVRDLFSNRAVDVGPSADQLSTGDRPGSLPAPQVVKMDVATLVAEGINVPAQAGGVQDGRVQVLRFDNYLLIGDQFYQYASGPGYPLVPVAGPVLQGDIGVQHGPMPVLLPQQEPAFAAIPTSPAFASPTPAAPASPPLADAPGTGAEVTTTPAQATPALPAADSDAGIIVNTQSQVPNAAAAVLVPNAATAGISSPIAPATPTALANLVREGLGAVASSMAGPLFTAATAATLARTGNLVLGGAAPAATIVPTSTTDSDRDGTGAVATQVTAPPPSLQPLAPTDTPGMVVATPATAAPTEAAAPGSVTAIPNQVSQTSPMARGFEPTLAPDSPEPRGDLDGGLPSGEAGAWASIPTGVATDPGTIDVDRPVPTSAEGLPGEVVDSIDLGAVARGGAVQDAETEAVEDSESVSGVIPIAVASVTSLAWGNLVFSARIADRHRQEESESPEADQ